MTLLQIGILRALSNDAVTLFFDQLLGVGLETHTTVGADSIVTKPFSDGNCILAGNPAHIIHIFALGEE